MRDGLLKIGPTTFALTHAYPIRQRARHLPVAQQEIETREAQSMLDKDIIEPKTSSWSSRVVLVKKTDGLSGFA